MRITLSPARYLCRSFFGLLIWLSGTGAAHAAEKVVLQLPYTHQFQFAGFYAAQFKGFFAEEGLEVELREGSAGRRPYAELTSGRAEYGVGSATYLMDRLNGAPLVLVTPICQHSPLAVMVLANSDIRAPEDLRGKRLAAGSTTRYPEIASMFELEGLKPESFVRVDDKWDVDEILTGDADAELAFITDVPYDMQQRGIAIRLIRPSDYGVDFYGDTLFTSEKEAESHPERVRAMRRAVLRGWQYALEHPNEVIEWIEHNLPNRPARTTVDRMHFEARQMSRLINAGVIELGHVNPGRWRRIAETYLALGMVKDLKRFDGFIPKDELTGLPRWVKALMWGLGLVVVLAVLMLLANRRLQKLVERRTQELREAERQQHEFFNLAPAPIVVEDVREIVARLEQLRAAGVSDLRAHLDSHPEEVPQLFYKTKVVAANQRALQVSGFKSAAEMEQRLGEIMTPQAMETFRDELQALWEKRDSLTLEKEYTLRGDQVSYMLLNWSVTQVAGQPDYGTVRLVFTEITDQKRAAQALRESEESYRRLFEATPNPMYIFDVETLRFVMVNEAAVQRYGYSREEFAQMTILDIRPEDEMQRLRGIVTQINQDSQSGIVTTTGLWRHRRKDGSEILVEVFTHTMTLKDRTCCLVLPFDMTAKLAAERALRESEARYRELFENAAGGVYRSTPEGTFLAVNPAMARIMGCATVEEFMNYAARQPLAGLYVQPERRAEFMAALEKDDQLVDFQSEVRRPDGTTAWISENVRLVHDAAGRVLYFEGFVSDVTARRRLDAELMRTSKLEAVGILAGGIAHDFNNILTVVLGNVTLAEMDTSPDSSIRRMLHDSKRATLRARDLTQQLLTFAKGGDPVRAAVELPELLRESADFALHGAKARAEFNIAPDLWAANADKGQLAQVMQNLVINSVQAMPQGGTVKITAANVELPLPGGRAPALPPGRYVRLTVADTGVGIAPEHLPKIFDPYFTTKQQGSGLGLATVYSIVKKHQGHAEVESRLGQGTAFHIWLPAASGGRAVAPAPSVQPTAVSARVLFMDDEGPIREMARMFLQRLGATCEVCIDGTEVVEKYQAARSRGQPFDVVVMDLTVPGGMGGREAMERLRQIDPAVRAVVSSGYSSDPVLANYRAHGFSGILPKPYGMEHMRQVLHAVLNPRKT